MPRVFFALWPEPGQRDKLHSVALEMQHSCGGRVMPRENLHQTLVFVGSLASARVAALEAAATQIDATPFTLEFGVTGYWRHNRIIWAAPSAMPQALAGLVTALERGLTQHGIAYDRRPYAAHVTLVRDARAPAVLLPLEFGWLVRDFALIESGRGARGAEYRVLARWRLTG